MDPLNHRALLIVDVQPTFCEEGELPVTGGNAVAQSIASFLRGRGEEYDLIATTQDWHVDPGEHFSSEPDFVDTWPPHGIAGSANAQLHPALRFFAPDVSVKKGEYAAAYSGFEGVTADGKLLDEVLKAEGITDVDVVGLAESHCVKDTAIDARRLGYRTRVLSDLTAPVSEETGLVAREAMKEAGVEYVESTSL